MQELVLVEAWVKIRGVSLPVKYVITSYSIHYTKLYDLAHPFGIALGQIVIHGDHVDPAPAEGVEIDREGGDQGLAFAGLHLGDAALVQDDAADQLDVEMALAEGPLGGLAHRREGFRQQVLFTSFLLYLALK